MCAICLAGVGQAWKRRDCASVSPVCVRNGTFIHEIRRSRSTTPVAECGEGLMSSTYSLHAFCTLSTLCCWRSVFSLVVLIALSLSPCRVSEGVLQQIWRNKGIPRHEGSWNQTLEVSSSFLPQYVGTITFILDRESSSGSLPVGIQATVASGAGCTLYGCYESPSFGLD